MSRGLSRPAIALPVREFGALAACVLVAATWPGSAWAHANLVRTEPADLAVLATAPPSIRVVFDDDIRRAGGNAAVSNSSRSSVLAGPARVVGGKTLVLPLRSHLADGDYTVRWSIVSDDGHREQGLLAFGVGAGRAPPGSILTVENELRWQDVLLRTLFLLGVLVAVGSLLQLRGGAGGRGLVFVAFTLASLGGVTLLHDAGATGTRFARALEVGATAALVGATAAALLPWYPRVRPLLWIAAGVLLPIPTLSGHALDPGRPRLLAAALDLVHVGASAAWLGGLTALAFATPTDRAVEAARRLSRVALASVLLLAGTGAGRALIELDALSQLWTTGYGRAILVKTALFAGLLWLGWINRVRLLPALDRVGDALVGLRRNVVGETALLAGVVIAVAVLTTLRPAGQKAVAAREPEVAPPPPAAALQLARQDRDLAVAIAVRRSELTATLLSPNGRPFTSGASLAVDGERVTGASCGDGCVRASVQARPRSVVVSPEGYPPVRFELPGSAPSAAALLARAERAFHRLRTVTVEETLASGPAFVSRSRQLMIAPDRFAYEFRDGTAGIVIGRKRWDRVERGPWRAGAQLPPLRLPTLLWSSARRDARLIGPGRIAFFDPGRRAWFDVQLDPRTKLPLEVHMIAAAHFMTELYSGFDRAARIVPPR